MKIRSGIFLLLLASVACTEKLEVEPFVYHKIFTGETSKGYTLKSAAFLQAGKTPSPISIFDPDSFDQCVVDDIYTFYNNPERRFEVSEGATRCNSTDPDVYIEDTWSFVNANATLTIPFPLLGGVVPFIVTSADERSLVLEVYFDDNKQGYRFSFRSTTGG